MSDADPSELDALRARWEKALERDRPADAIKALVVIAKRVPDQPQWLQRLAESYQRAGRAGDAVDAFARAAAGYAEKGFLPRAIAMAKLVAGLDPSRGDLLAGLTPKAPAISAMPALSPVSVQPVLLERAADASPGEVRFADVDGGGRPSIEIVLEEVEDVPVLRDADVVSVRAPEPLPVDRLHAMAASRLFAGLSRPALLALSCAAELARFDPGATVIVRDEAAHALFAIVEGTVRVSVRGGADVLLGEGEVFGEACLLDEGQRAADVRAQTALMTLRIAKAALDEVTAQHADVEAALFQLLARRLVSNLMQTSGLFTAFEPGVRLELARMFEVRRAIAGTVLAERGRRSDGLYVLLAGHLLAEQEAGEPTRVARGGAFGHASLVGAQSRAATVRAVTESVLLRLPAARFNTLAALYPPALAYLAETLGEPLCPTRPPPVPGKVR